MAVVRVEKRNNEICIVIDGAVRDALELNEGDELDVTVDEQGLHLSPSEFSSPKVRDAFERVIEQYDETLRKLAQ